ESAADLVAAARRSASSPPESYPSAQVMKREVLYNELRPTRLSWILLVPAAVLAFFWWRRSERWMGVATSAGLVAGFVVMTWGIALRWQAAGRIPASNMYESMLFLAWGVGLFAVLAVFLVKNRLAVFNGAAMSALVMLLTDLLPMDAFIHPMPPVLSGTPWLAIHVPIIMVSYALLALAAFVAHMRLGVEIFGSGLRENAALLDEVHYWYVQLGSILLIVGILTGSIWAASSWGRYWGWDPKEVWSLIAFLAYMAILHGRIDRWLGAVGVAAASVMAFGTILMTYLGVNYVLAAGLHSYGFGGSKIATWLVIGGVVEAVYVTIGVIAYKRNQKRSFSGLQQFRDPGSREAD
ncbi:MAG: cytochrome c biogenesis protein CcsA, partial [Candidatus Sulfomarinibacteraceae bacterium]